MCDFNEISNLNKNNHENKRFNSYISIEYIPI